MDNNRTENKLNPGAEPREDIDATVYGGDGNTGFAGASYEENEAQTDELTDDEEYSRGAELSGGSAAGGGENPRFQEGERA